MYETDIAPVHIKSLMNEHQKFNFLGLLYNLHISFCGSSIVLSLSSMIFICDFNFLISYFKSLMIASFSWLNVTNDSFS